MPNGKRLGRLNGQLLIVGIGMLRYHDIDVRTLPDRRQECQFGHTVAGFTLGRTNRPTLPSLSRCLL